MPRFAASIWSHFTQPHEKLESLMLTPLPHFLGCSGQPLDGSSIQVISRLTMLWIYVILGTISPNLFSVSTDSNFKLSRLPSRTPTIACS